VPQTARIVIPGVAHHVTQRGNNRQDVFFADDDRRVYLDILRQQAARWGVRLLGLAAGIDYRALLARPEDKEVLRRLRTSTPRGRPLASDAFLAKVEHALGRRLRPLSVGRPSKAARGGPK
jgi:hypothetical protein